MKKYIILPFLLVVLSCAELQSIAETVLENPTAITEAQISSGLKEALQNGIDHQVTKLTIKNGFLKNDLVKIGLPDEVEKVENTLRSIGLGSLADEGIKLMNRAAEDAVKEATPIFVNAIKEMSITDAKNILMGNSKAATQFLEQKTSSQLYQKFYPVVEQSFSKVGADKIWTTAIDKYNTLPMTKKVENNITEYVTQQALQGVYKMISIEESKIRSNINARTSDLLKKVFALQDKA